MSEYESSDDESDYEDYFFATVSNLKGESYKLPFRFHEDDIWSVMSTSLPEILGNKWTTEQYNSEKYNIYYKKTDKFKKVGFLLIDGAPKDYIKFDDLTENLKKEIKRVIEEFLS